MASVKDKVPKDPKLDLNTYMNKYITDDSVVGNPLNLLNIESPYYDIDEVYCNISNLIDTKTTFEYTAIHLNIQSLPAKIDKLKLLISELRDKHIELDFIMLCETFLKDAISHQFNIPGYNLVCTNRSNKTRGGVAIYVNSKFNFTKRDDLAINIHGTFESVFIEIQSDKFKAVVGEIYRVPNTNQVNTINMYETIIKKLQYYKHNIIIGTDQNMDYIKIDKQPNTENLLGVFLSNGLIPTITKPTRITHSTATLIDNLYITTENKSNIHSAILCLDISDHLPVLLCVGRKTRSNKAEPLIIRKRHLTSSIMKNIATVVRETNWLYLENMNTDHAYTEFSNTLDTIINNAAPEKEIKISSKFVIRDPWVTRGLIASSRTLNKLYRKKMGKDKKNLHYEKFINYRNMYNKLKRLTKQKYYDDLLSKYQHNIRKTWGIINSLIGRTNDKGTISEIFKINNIAINNPTQISNEFCKFFTNIGKQYANDIPNSKYSPNHYMLNKINNNMYMAPTDTEEIVKYIESLKKKTVQGMII